MKKYCKNFENHNSSEIHNCNTSSNKFYSLYIANIIPEFISRNHCAKNIMLSNIMKINFKIANNKNLNNQ